MLCMGMCVHLVMLVIIKSFFCRLRIELIKPAMELFRHNLTGTLEASVRATNAQYNDNNILQRLDVRTLEVIIIIHKKRTAV